MIETVLLTLLILILAAIYLRFGMWIFDMALDTYGGKENYLHEISKQKPNVNVNLVYAIALCLVMCFWPYFVIVSLIWRGK